MEPTIVMTMTVLLAGVCFVKPIEMEIGFTFRQEGKFDGVSRIELAEDQPSNGFAYLLESGECLTAPEVQLDPVAVRVRAGLVEVRPLGVLSSQF